MHQAISFKILHLDMFCNVCLLSKKGKKINNYNLSNCALFQNLKIRADNLVAL